MRSSLLSKLLGTATVAVATTAVAANAAGASIELSDGDRETGETQISDLVDRAHAEGLAEGKKQGATDERARYAAVLNSDEAKGRTGLALSLLSTTDLEADTIIKNLSTSPKEIGATTAAPVPAPAPGQTAAVDPIAAATPLVDPGASQAGGDGTVKDGMDEKAVVGMWNEAFGRSGLGASADVWSGLLGTEQRAN